MQARIHGRTIASARVRGGVARLRLPVSERAITILAVDRAGRTLSRSAIVTARR